MPVEVFEWMTDIIDPFTPSFEQRIRLRKNPRRMVSYQVSLWNPDFSTASEQRRKFMSFLRGSHGKIMNVPIWMDATYSQTVLSIGATTIPVDTRWKDYEIGGKIQIGKDFNYEIATISGMTTTTLTVSALTKNWPKGTSLAPIRRGYLSQSLEGLNLANDQTEVKVDFTLDYTEVSTNRVTTYVPPATFLDDDILDADSMFWGGRTDYASDIGFNINHKVTIVDGQTGAFFPVDHFAPLSGMSFENRTHRILTKNRQETSELLGWLYHRAGRFKSFYTPTFEEDIKITSSPDSTHLVIVDINYKENYFDNGGGRGKYLYIVKGDGTQVYQTVTNAIDNGNGTETLTISPGSDFSSGFSSAGFLVPRRLEADRVELNWHTNEIVACELQFRDLYEGGGIS